MDTMWWSNCIRREFCAFFVSSRSLLNRLIWDGPTEIYTMAGVYYVFLTHSPREALKEKWWRFRR